MATPPTEAQVHLERFYGALRNLNDLELRDFRNVITGVLRPTPREKILTVNYHRAAIDVGMLLSIKDTRQVQAVAMLARAVFELSVEIKLINLHADAANKVDVFTRVEKLRAAKKVVAFKEAHPQVHFHFETQQKFIRAYGQSIQAERLATWPGRDRVKHWTLKSLANRAKDLGDPFDRIYEVHYLQLSWDATRV